MMSKDVTFMAKAASIGATDFSILDAKPIALASITISISSGRPAVPTLLRCKAGEHGKRSDQQLLRASRYLSP
jgi:hypothetical protein